MVISRCSIGVGDSRLLSQLRLFYPTLVNPEEVDATLAHNHNVAKANSTFQKIGNLMANWFITVLACSLLQPGQITTFAGTGQTGYSGDGGPATQARFSQPFSCATDARSGLFVADALNHCIRYIDGKTGICTTVVGTGQKGYAGDGGPATKATLNEPYAVVLDERQNLYIVDRLNAVVRRVEARTGIITTLAGTGVKGFAGDGGPATHAQFREPNDCILDGQGGLLVADVADWRIRRIDLGTGIISTFAGIGKPADRKLARSSGDGGPALKAVLAGARAVCVDGKGNVYICEREGNTIRKVDSSGIITTVAGTGAKGYSGDGGAPLQATLNGPKGLRCDLSGNLLIADCENHAIRKVDFAKNQIATIVGGRRGAGGDNGPAVDAQLNRPHGCIMAKDGTLFICDSENFRVRQVAPHDSKWKSSGSAKQKTGSLATSATSHQTSQHKSTAFGFNCVSGLAGHCKNSTRLRPQRLA